MELADVSLAMDTPGWWKICSEMRDGDQTNISPLSGYDQIVDDRQRVAGGRAVQGDKRMSVPEGFEPLFRNSPYTDTIGPLYYRKDRDLVLGVRILKKHTNARGFAHGGLLLTLADLALGYGMAFRETPPASLITASLSADFAGTAKIDDWVEAHVDIQKSGARLAFANTYLMVGNERILRASAVFARTGTLDTPQVVGAPRDGHDAAS